VTDGAQKMDSLFVPGNAILLALTWMYQAGGKRFILP
jgi:hypothetical protein